MTSGISLQPPWSVDEQRQRILEHVRSCVKVGSPDFGLRVRHAPMKLKKHKKTGQPILTWEEFFNQIALKWSEQRGKYVGCRFWTAGAAAVLEEQFRLSARAISFHEAARMAEELASKRIGGNKLTHEHVSPRSVLKRQLLQMLTASPNLLTDIKVLERFLDVWAVGCVCLESEHQQFGNEGCSPNPWLRYARAKSVRVRACIDDAVVKLHEPWLAELQLESAL